MSTLLHVGVGVALVGGIGLILGAGPVLTGVGVLLVILGLIGLMPALYFRLAANPPAPPG